MLFDGVLCELHCWVGFGRELLFVLFMDSSTREHSSAAKLSECYRLSKISNILYGDDISLRHEDAFVKGPSHRRTVVRKSATFDLCLFEFSS
jgi:hypothetical protein